MSKALISSSFSHSTITETSCDFYPDNSNQARERNLVFFFSEECKKLLPKKNQDYLIDKTSPNYVSGNHD